jgi:Sulfotransferase domain
MPIESQFLAPQSSAITLLKERLSHFDTEEGRLYGLAYVPKPNDVVISTTPKAGTTWMQQICHQIRCAANYRESAMEFEEISAVVPWLELAFDLGQDVTIPQSPDLGRDELPRLFKTHCWYHHCPRFPKTIVVFRDPCDVLLSFYRFFEGWFFEPGSIDIETFADEFWLARGLPQSKMQNASYFYHLISWYERREDTSTVLIVFYEDLLDDLEGQVRRIARFLSNDRHNFESEEIIQHAVSHSTYDFMKLNESQFDEKLCKLARNEACGLSRDAGTSQSKINAGKKDSGRSTLSEAIKSKIQQKWTDLVLPATGCTNYSELRNQFAASKG